MASKKTPSSVYHLKVTLMDSKPPIWRDILVPSTMTLDRIHRVLQVAMGWDNGHLHQFISGGTFYGSTDPLDGLEDNEVENEKKYTIAQLLLEEKRSIVYEYDFGDSWRHKITLKKILPADENAKQVRCLKGKRACPPEDCGGIWGYEDLLTTLEDPHHPERKNMLEWLGGEFDPEYFDVDEINLELKEIKV